MTSKDVRAKTKGLLSGINMPAQVDSDTAAQPPVDSAYIQELNEEIERLRQQVEGAIVKSGNVYRFRRFQLAPTYLIVPESFNEQEAFELGFALAGIDDAVQFWIGDWANLYIGDEQNEQKRGEMYAYLEDQVGIKARTIQNYASVCRNLPPSLRREGIGFSVHREIAELPSELKGKEEYFVAWAALNSATVAQIKGYISDKLVELRGIKTPITDDSFLFAKAKLPKNPVGLQSAWSKARNGDKNAKKKLLGEIMLHRKWLDELEESLED